jgi:Protein of unknown function (DUF1214)
MAMGDAVPANSTGPVFHELLDELRSLEGRLLASPNALGDEQFVAETYRWILSIAQVAFDCFVWGDRDNPRFVDIVGPYKKWGGDNADAFYQWMPIDPARTYQMTGRRGDAAYLSLTVYGGPDDGRYSDRIVGSLNDRQLDVGPGGEFELWLSPTEPPADRGADGSASPGAEPGGARAWIRLEPDAVCAVTRDYLHDPERDTRATWHVAAVDPPATWRASDERLAAGMRAALTWIRDQSRIVPLTLGPPNTVDDPYPVPQQTVGWAAGDAAYAMGSFSLADGDVLVLRGRSPACAFWNLCLWNPYLHTYNYDYDRVTINGAQVVYEDDGSWTIEVAAHDTGHPNWVCTQGHDRGRLWFRWFLPEATPDPVAADVVRR